MITTTDAANIMYVVCQDFEMPVYQGGNVPQGRITNEGRVVVHVKEQTAETFWRKCFVEVNIFVADTPNGNADLIQLNEIERAARRFLEVTGTYDDTTYSTTISSICILAQEELKSHYVNARILFKALNTIE